jgi:uncharacterized metal-binding protein YceD (DUF177 family)
VSDFEHRLPLDRIRDGDRVDLSADESECAAIADRLGLLRLDRLDAHAVLARDGDKVRATGRIKAALEQSCVATGEPVPAHVDEPFEILFLAEPKPGHADDEIELGAEELDTMFHDGSGIELGSAIVDSLALALDPYPRSTGADAALKEAGVLSEEEAGPFAALAALREKLGGSGA